MREVKYFAICPIQLFMILDSCILAFLSSRQIPSNNDSDFHCSTLDIKSGLHGRRAIIDPNYRWKTFRVHLEDSIASEERELIQDVMQTLREILPCVEFEISDSTHVLITRDGIWGGCYFIGNRSDRDKHVTIYWENMDPRLYPQFMKVTDEEFSDFGVPYNHRSIMHYAGTINSKPTVLTKDGNKIPYSTTLQDTDILKLQRMYGCANEVA